MQVKGRLKGWFSTFEYRLMPWEAKVECRFKGRFKDRFNTVEYRLMPLSAGLKAR
jgi:hypothetical protein